MTTLNIVPECYVDTKLAEILGQATRKYNHQHGHGNVSNKMQNDLKNEFALGIIDEDTIKVRKADYFSDFSIIKTENNLILKRHPALPHFLIVICPVIEKWLLENSKQAEVIPETFDLPNELKDFAHISKIKDIDKNIGFKRFIKELVEKKAPGILTLKNWIEAFNLYKLDTIK